MPPRNLDLFIWDVGFWASEKSIGMGLESWFMFVPYGK